MEEKLVKMRDVAFALERMKLDVYTIVLLMMGIIKKIGCDAKIEFDLALKLYSKNILEPPILEEPFYKFRKMIESLEQNNKLMEESNSKEMRDAAFAMVVLIISIMSKLDGNAERTFNTALKSDNKSLMEQLSLEEQLHKSMEMVESLEQNNKLLKSFLLWEKA
jgi:hypothetical protein